MPSLRQVLAAAASAGLILTGFPAFSEDAPPSPHSLELARHVFAAMNINQTMDNMTKFMLPAMVAQARRANPNLSEAQAAIVTQAVTDAMPGFMGKFVDRMVPLYASTFTEQELQDLATFYDSPSGRAMRAKMPALAAKMTPTMMELMPEFQAEVHQRICSKMPCPKPGASPAPKT
jgi:hypothetical protein